MRRLIGLLFALGAVSNAHAWGITFDPVNWMENLVSAAQSVKQTAAQIQSVQTQMEMARMGALQVKSMNPDKFLAILAENDEDYREVWEAKRAMDQLHGSIGDLGDRYRNRLMTASALKMSWDQYRVYENSRISRNQEDAVRRAKEDVRAMDRVAKDYEFAKNMESKISGTAGTHEAMQVMNAQMNRVITQNAEMTRALQASLGQEHSAEKQMQKAEADRRAVAERDHLVELSKARKEADKKALEKWSVK